MGVNLSADQVKDYKWPDAKVLGQVEDEKLICFEKMSGRASMQSILAQAEDKKLTQEEIALVTNAYNERYRDMGKSAPKSDISGSGRG